MCTRAVRVRIAAVLISYEHVNNRDFVMSQCYLPFLSTSIAGKTGKVKSVLFLYIREPN